MGTSTLELSAISLARAGREIRRVREQFSATNLSQLLGASHASEKNRIALRSVDGLRERGKSRTL
jgi:hypothetical protein